MGVVAIDQGTSSTRAFVLDDHGPGEIVCTCSHKQIYPTPGWVEHDPLELLKTSRPAWLPPAPWTPSVSPISAKAVWPGTREPDSPFHRQSADATPVFSVEGGVYSAGSALNWDRSPGLFSDFAEINQFENRSAISRNIAFVPALTGLGCPHWDGTAAGMWIA